MFNAICCQVAKLIYLITYLKVPNDFAKCVIIE